MRGKKIVRTVEEMEWFKANYPDLLDVELARKMRVGKTTIYDWGKKFGLVKSDKFRELVSRTRSDSLKRYYKAHPREGHSYEGCRKTYFRSGQSILERYGAESERKRVEHMKESIRRLRKSEKARVAFGLPQRTKLRIMPQNVRRLRYKYNLQSRGYIVDDERRLVFWNDQTRRFNRLESRDQPWYKFQAIS